jgi:uncharacterized membrane protein
MTLDPTIVLTILGMALVTYAARAGGFLIVQRLPIGPFARRFLDHIPGATFAALIAPAVFAGGPLEWAGVVVTAAIVRVAGHPLPAMLTGVAVVAIGRQLGWG